MSDPKIISPLLDGFKLGAPICEHNGITCRPAIKENSNKKYIVKMVTVPANQAQLDALLLAGAYRDPAEAMEYFRKKGEGILKEAEHLKVLSKLEGFLPYEGWQMEPITRHRLGYEVYLLSTYKRSLAKYMAKNAFTHLEAINLGMDLCSALSVCRQSGYLYVDLKPSNIYVSEKKEYRIGDLGFLNLNSLRYASLPEQYHSPYSPPELLDPMNSVNLSADTYAVGMIMYQLYNDGHLPFKGIAPEQPFQPPIHADYELAEIIMKAISSDPEQRWQDPKDLGKAIAAYMQRNSVNDIPITPFIPLDVEPEQIAKKSRKKSNIKQEKPIAETVSEPAEIPSEVTEETVSETQVPQEENLEEGTLSTDTELAATQEEVVSVPMETVSEETVSIEAADADTAVTESITAPPLQAEILPTENITKDFPADVFAETEQQTSISENTIPEQPTEDDTAQKPVEEIAVSEEVARIITKADDLIAYQIPDGVLYPTEPEIDPFAFALEDTDDFSDIEEDELLPDEGASEDQQNKQKPAKHFADQTRARKVRRFFGGIFGTAFVAAACVGGYWFYQNVYLQPVDSMTVSGTQDQITVLIDTVADEAGLRIICSDGHGNTFTESVQGGKVVFENLDPSTEYTLTADISGFHKLTGATSEVFKTESATRILTFQAITGSEPGSVFLEFTVEGNEPDFWNIYYSAEGEDEKRETITNHSTTISGLTVGKVYTFTLDGGKDFDLSGNKQLQYVASKLILAENLTANSEDSGEIIIRWKAPGDAVIDSWKVRCFDGYGFDEEFTVNQTQAQLANLNSDVDYTIEITAAGMTEPASIKLTADRLNVVDFQVDESKKTKLNVSWDYIGISPSENWILTYTVDGSGIQTLECPKEQASISPLIPGATYDFTLQTADERTVFNNIHSFTTANAEVFADNGMKPEDLSFDLVKTPTGESWTYEILQDDAFTDTFAAGEPVSLVIRSASTFYMAGYETKVMFVIRNSYGNVFTDLVSEETYSWKNIWQAGDPKIGELNIPKLPSAPGDYVLELYFNGKSVTELDFHIT